MLFTRIFAAAALVASVVAQGKLQFTTLPSNVEVGKAVSIKWTGGDGSPVTVTLKKGDPKDLKTVKVISGGVSGDSFTWTPEEDLPSGDDYALSISQGVNTINYTGQFTIAGGSSSSSSATSASSGSATSTATVTVKSSGTTSVTSTVVITGVSTGIMTMSRNATMSSATLRNTNGISAGTDSPTATSTGEASSTSSSAASNLKAQVAVGVGALAAVAFAL